MIEAHLATAPSGRLFRQLRATWPAIYDELLAHLRAAKPDGAGVQEFIRILKLHNDI